MMPMLPRSAAAATRRIASLVASGSPRSSSLAIQHAPSLSTLSGGIGGSNARPAALPPNRSLSSYSYGGGGGGGGGMPSASPGRAYPSYSIWDASSVLIMKPILPIFKQAGRDGIGLEKRGYVLLEFVPRAAGAVPSAGGKSGPGSAMWDDAVRFGLSAEEIGLVVNQLPQGAGVELIRKGHGAPTGGLGEDPAASDEAVSTDIPDKVLRIQPLEHGAVKFDIDLMKDGVSSASGTVKYPQSVTVQAGEFEVFMSLLNSAIPYVLGWSTMMDVDMAHRIALTRSGGGYGGGGGGGGGGSYL